MHEFIQHILGFLGIVLTYLQHGLDLLEQTLSHSSPLEHFGAITAAITGVLAARSKKIDVFGILVLGFVTAVGGGSIRDLCLDTRMWWIDAPSFTIAILITCLITFFLARLTRLQHRKLLDVADAFAMALFTALGTWKALKFGTDCVNSIMMGVITGVAGGIIRDVLLGTIPNVLRPGIYLYATASVCGSVLFVIFDAFGIPYKWIVSISIILALRLSAIHWKLSLPEYHDTDEISPQNPS
ncbi:MAG: trimeric intracellular cation channel family protein [Verrucomicrobia bacterium]|nr:trimeric intracellular cation channel family protein [Verrucomicrobiota bacterium]